jgi:Flp pilus assembly protein TadG
MRHFWSDRKGNIAVLFALAIVPVVGGIGAAIDYSLANSYRADMQKALDSTALALSKIAPADDATLHRVGMEYFVASMGNHPMTDLNLDIVPDAGKGNLHVTANDQPVVADILGI